MVIDHGPGRPRSRLASSTWVLNGLQFAAIFGLLGWSFMVLPVAAKYRMSSVRGFMLLESCFVALQFLLTGMLMALVYSF